MTAALTRSTAANILAEIRHLYRPYDTMPAFDEGFADYQAGIYQNPYDNDETLRGQVNGQAWDRGANTAMRYNAAIRQMEVRR